MSTAFIQPHEGIRVRTAHIADQPHLLSLIGADNALAWVRGPADDQYGIVAWGEVNRVEVDGPERFSRAQRWWTKWCSTAFGDEPIAFASFAFSSSSGSSVVVIPKFVVRRTEQGTTLTVTSDAHTIDDDIAHAESELAKPRPIETAHHSVTWSEGSRPIEDWAAAVDTAVQRINAGELDKVVLARDIVATLDEPLNVGALLRKLNNAFPECWTFSVDGLIGATPELLIRKNHDQVTSRVLAGTVRRSSDSHRDDQLAQALMGSDKDQEEHAYAVASVASALASHCTDLNVPEEPFILQLANVQHLATDISGELVDGASALALAASLHPTAAVCGTPTERAALMIRELELMDRGRYSAPIGWIDRNSNGEFGIALRCAQIENAERTQLRLYAGCGIVSGSTSESEVAESKSKFAAMHNALEN